jgi:hypothetical protein
LGFLEFNNFYLAGSISRCIFLAEAITYFTSSIKDFEPINLVGKRP